MRISMFSTNIDHDEPWPVCPYCGERFDAVGPDHDRNRHAAHTCEPDPLLVNLVLGKFLDLSREDWTEDDDEYLERRRL